MKQPIALLITDTHLHDGNIELVKDIFQQAIEQCKKHKIDRIFHLGDWFTSRKSQSEAVLLATQEIIASFVGNDIPCYIIKGNHDATQADSNDSFINIFHSSHFIVKDGEYGDQYSDDLWIWFLPYYKESGSYPERLQNILTQIIDINTEEEERQKHILLTHIAITGVKNNDCTLVENNLSKNQFQSFYKTFVGHYHDQSQIGENIYYIGSAYQNNYGENNAKGFTLLYNDSSHEFIKSKFKEYIKVSLDITDEESIKKAKKQYANSTDNVRFVFQGDDAELKHVNKEKYAELGIDVDFNKNSAIPMNNDDLIEKASSLSFDRQNIFAAFDTFCEIKHIEDNSIGKSYLEKI